MNKPKLLDIFIGICLSMVFVGLACMVVSILILSIPMLQWGIGLLLFVLFTEIIVVVITEIKIRGK